MKKTLSRSTIHRKNTWRTYAAQFLHPRCIYVAIKEFVLSGKYQDVFDCCFYYIYLSSKCNTHFAKMHNFCRLSQFLALEAMRCDWTPWQPIKIGRATWSLPPALSGQIQSLFPQIIRPPTSKSKPQSPWRQSTQFWKLCPFKWQSAESRVLVSFLCTQLKYFLCYNWRRRRRLTIRCLVSVKPPRV